jgi:hypothetical protein
MPKRFYLGDLLPDDKQKYIDQLPASQKLKDDRVALVKALPYEERFGKDISEFTEEEREILYKEMHRSLKTLHKYRKAYIDYSRWKGKTDSVFEDELTVDKAAGYSEAMFIVHRGQLREWVNNPAVSPVDAFLLIAPYEGIYGKGSELIEIKYRDLTEEGIIIQSRGKGKLIPWSEELKTAVERILKKEEDWSSEDYLLKDIRTIFGIRARYSRVKPKLGIPKETSFGPVDLWYNGMLDYIKSIPELSSDWGRAYALISNPAFDRVKLRFNISTTDQNIGMQLVQRIKADKGKRA